MSVVDIRTALLTLITNMTGINFAGEETIGEVNTFPVGIVRVSQAEMNKVMADVEEVRRQYTLTFLVAPVAQEGTQYKAENDTQVLMDSVRATLQSKPGLSTVLNTNPVANLLDCYVLNDSGFYVADLGAAQYAAFDITLQTIEYYAMAQGA